MTPWKLVSCCKQTLTTKYSKYVGISGSSHKQAITGTFVITLGGKCLPFQLLHVGKTLWNLPKFKFPDDFLLCRNEKYYNNHNESMKIFLKIIFPYLEKTQKDEELANN